MNYTKSPMDCHSLAHHGLHYRCSLIVERLLKVGAGKNLLRRCALRSSARRAPATGPLLPSPRDFYGLSPVVVLTDALRLIAADRIVTDLIEILEPRR